ncbi:MAG: hypothetical protein ACRD3C_21560 [Vicinamibacterales bacterium]
MESADIIALPQLASRRSKHGGWMAICPEHDDRARSLSLRLGDDGRLLVNCFAGCRTRTVIAALDLEFRDLFPPPTSDRSTIRTRRRPRGSALDQARAAIFREALRQQGRLARYGVLWQEADSVRLGFRVVADARRVATRLREGDRAWELLGAAAVVEAEAWNVEAALNQLLAEKRLP